MKSDSGRPVLIFIVPAVLFQIASIAGYVPGDYFHLTAGLLDLAVVCMLILWTKAGLMPVLMGLVSVVSIFTNALGWFAYENYYDSMVYDWAYVAIYSLVLLLASMEWLHGAGAGLSNMLFRSYRHQRH